MVRLKRLVALWFLCSQVLLVSVTGVSAAAYDDLHVATAHQLALDHHHHDEFSSHFDRDDGAGSHTHVVDSFQSYGMVEEGSGDFGIFGGQTQPNLAIARPPAIFLEGLLRPPQTLL
ncbi:MAG: hypothetical protein ACO3GJ_06790 [Burkholderiaceae bacterium]|jgi:hypothetical protein